MTGRAGGMLPDRFDLDVLVPTADRPAELATTLAGLAAQSTGPFRVLVSDQSLGGRSGIAVG